jgi:hypothetical protein
MRRLSISNAAKILSPLLIDFKRHIARVGPYPFPAQHHFGHPKQVANHHQAVAVFGQIHRERVPSNVTTYQLTHTYRSEAPLAAGELYSHDGETWEFKTRPCRS